MNLQRAHDSRPSAGNGRPLGHHPAGRRLTYSLVRLRAARAVTRRVLAQRLRFWQRPTRIHRQAAPVMSGPPAEYDSPRTAAWGAPQARRIGRTIAARHCVRHGPAPAGPQPCAGGPKLSTQVVVQLRQVRPQQVARTVVGAPALRVLGGRRYARLSRRPLAHGASGPFGRRTGRATTAASGSATWARRTPRDGALRTGDGVRDWPRRDDRRRAGRTHYGRGEIRRDRSGVAVGYRKEPGDVRRPGASSLAPHGSQAAAADQDRRPPSSAAQVLTDERMERALEPLRLRRIRESIARVNREDSCVQYVVQRDGDPMHELDGSVAMIFSQNLLWSTSRSSPWLLQDEPVARTRRLRVPPDRLPVPRSGEGLERPLGLLRPRLGTHLAGQGTPDKPHRLTRSTWKAICGSTASPRGNRAEAAGRLGNHPGHARVELPGHDPG